MTKNDETDSILIHSAYYLLSINTSTLKLEQYVFFIRTKYIRHKASEAQKLRTC